MRELAVKRSRADDENDVIFRRMTKAESLACENNARFLMEWKQDWKSVYSIIQNANLEEDLYQQTLTILHHLRCLASDLSKMYKRQQKSKLVNVEFSGESFEQYILRNMYLDFNYWATPAMKTAMEEYKVPMERCFFENEELDKENSSGDKPNIENYWNAADGQ